MLMYESASYYCKNDVITDSSLTKVKCADLFSPLNERCGTIHRPTFYKICMRKTTGQYSGLPYVATLLNCMLWTFYGAPAVAGLIFVVSINVAGLVLEITYVTIHLIFGTPKSRVYSNVASNRTPCLVVWQQFLRRIWLFVQIHPLTRWSKTPEKW